MATPTIRTIRALVEELGTPFLTEWLDISASAVSLWIARDTIPPAYHLRLFLELKRRRLKFDCAALFGITEDEARIVETVRRPINGVGATSA